MDWNNIYLAAINWGIQPSDFWEMTLAEWFTVYEMHAEAQMVGNTGMSEADLDDLADWIKKDGCSAP